MSYKNETTGYKDPKKGPQDLVSKDQNGNSLDTEYPAVQNPKNTDDVTEKTAVRVDPKITT